MEKFKELFPGMCGGLVQSLVGHPFDTIKVRMVHNNNRSVFQCMKNLYKTDGIKAFYRGVTPPLFGCILLNSVAFYTYNNVKIKLKDNYLNKFFAGCLSGVATSILESPMDLIKSQMQSRRDKKYIPFFKKLDLSKLYMGYTATLARNISSMGLFFCSFEYTKTCFDNQYIGALVGGAVSGFGRWGITYPLDFYKTKMQTDHIEPSKRVYSSLIDVAKRHSLSEVYNGYIPCMIRAFPVNSFLFLTVVTANNLVNLKDK